MAENSAVLIAAIAMVAIVGIVGTIGLVGTKTTVAVTIPTGLLAGGEGKAKGNACMAQCMKIEAPSYDASSDLTRFCQEQCNVGTGAGSCLTSADSCCVPYTNDPDCAPPPLKFDPAWIDLRAPPSTVDAIIGNAALPPGYNVTNIDPVTILLKRSYAPISFYRTSDSLVATFDGNDFANTVWLKIYGMPTPPTPPLRVELTITGRTTDGTPFSANAYIVATW